MPGVLTTPSTSVVAMVRDYIRDVRGIRERQAVLPTIEKSEVREVSRNYYSAKVRQRKADVKEARKQ